MEKLLKIFNSIILNKGLEPIDKINLDDKLDENLGFDSLDLAELTVRVEMEFNVDIFEDSIVRTVREICHKLDLLHE